MPHDFYIGDEVTAVTTDGRRIQGKISGLDFGKGDTLTRAIVHTGGNTAEDFHDVVPESLAYVVDQNGFWFKVDPNYATILIGRNDGLLLDPAWIKRKGAELLFRSMHPTHARRRVRRG